MSKSNNRKQMLRLLTDFSTVGMTVAFCIFIGVWIGHYLDQTVFEGRTAPWLTLIFLGIGIIAAFKNLYSIIIRGTKAQQEEDDD